MSTTEQITLFAIIITFATTLGGWIYTHRSQKAVQKEMALLNKKLSIEEEKRKYQLKQLDEIEAWFKEGMSLAKGRSEILTRIFQDSANYHEILSTWNNNGFYIGNIADVISLDAMTHTNNIDTELGHYVCDFREKVLSYNKNIRNDIVERSSEILEVAKGGLLKIQVMRYKLLNGNE